MERYAIASTSSSYTAGARPIHTPELRKRYGVDEGGRPVRTGIQAQINGRTCSKDRGLNPSGDTSAMKSTRPGSSSSDTKRAIMAALGAVSSTSYASMNSTSAEDGSRRT
eukprot:1001431-Prymnesium_polylepis.1